MRLRITRAALVAALAGLSTNAAAQSFIEMDTVPAMLGLGIGVAPDYRGSDDYTGAIAPFVRYTFPGSQRYVQLNANELTFNFVNHPRFRLGPVLNYHFGRDDDVDDNKVKRMREIDDTVEAGVFGEMLWTEQGNPRNRFILGLALLTDIGDESDGSRARLSARYWRQVAPAWDLHIGGGMIYANNKYNSTYFSVTTRNVGSSGLPLYDADSGMNEYFVTFGAVAYLSKNWLAMAGVRVSKLGSEPKDSPIVDRRGDSTQFIGGVGIGYMWH
jgi:outer membrane protein